MSNLKVSILVPAWNEASIIERAIESFLSLNYPNAKLIVVAGGEDDTYNLAKKYEGKKVKVFPQEKKGKNRALNLALSKAEGEVIILTDADCVMSDEWLSPLLEAMRKGEKAVSGTNMPLLEQLSNPFVLYQYSFTLAQSDRAARKEQQPYLDGKNAALRRIILEDLGGFDEEALTGTDFSLKHRLIERGINIKFIRKSVIQTEYPASFGKYLAQQSRWLRNFIIYGRKYSDKSEMKVFLEQALIAVFVFTLPFFTILSNYLALPWTVIFLLGIRNRVRIIRKARKASPELNFNSILPRLPVYLLIEYLSRILAFIEYILPSQRGKW